MGQSAPTPGEAFHAFNARYSRFRAALDPVYRRAFDELVCVARRHTTAINRYPHLDFERPVAVAILMDFMVRLDARESLHAEIRATRQSLVEAGLMAPPKPAASPYQVRLTGQHRGIDGRRCSRTENHGGNSS